MKNEKGEMEFLLDNVRTLIARSGKKVFMRETISKLNSNEEWDVVANPNELMSQLNPLIEIYGRRLRIIFKMRNGESVHYRGNGNCSNMPIEMMENYDKKFWKNKPSKKNLKRLVKKVKKSVSTKSEE